MFLIGGERDVLVKIILVVLLNNVKKYVMVKIYRCLFFILLNFKMCFILIGSYFLRGDLGI